MVAVVHAFQIFIIPYCGYWTYPHLLTSLLATYAIVVFFIVSGFMICISVLRHRTDGGFNGVGFAKARILRIYPPLIAAILITISVYLIISGFGLHGAVSYRLGGELDVVRENAKLEWSAIPTTFLLWYGVVPCLPFAPCLPGEFMPGPLTMDGPLWTLSYEWWLYILAFLTARLWNGWRAVIPLAFVILMLIYGRNLLFYRFGAIWFSGFALGLFYVYGSLFSAKAGRWILDAMAALLVFAVVVIVGGRTQGRMLLDLLGSGQNLMVITGLVLTLCTGLMIRRFEVTDICLPRLLNRNRRLLLHDLRHPLSVAAVKLQLLSSPHPRKILDGCRTRCLWSNCPDYLSRRKAFKDR